jgi:methylenetetrahydrofolate reductase (NADPH)
VRAYDRLKSHGAEDQLGAYHVAPRNLDLADTSSWINYYLGRDHSAERLGIPPAKTNGTGPQRKDPNNSSNPLELKKC